MSSMNFNWHIYLSETGAEISPFNLFSHVTQSFESLVKKGDTLEVNSKGFSEQKESKTQNSWWPAEVVLVSGYLILLKWCVPETSVYSSETNTCSVSDTHVISHYPSKNAFWFDVRGPDWQFVRPIGWCFSKNTNWTPPSQISHLNSKENNWKNPDWISSLQSRSVCNIFFDRRCLYTFETIRVGGYFECEHDLDPTCVWPAKVLMNIGGRVLLSWFGASSKTQACDKSRKLSTFTLFYLNRRLHPLGYGKLCDLKYCPPPGYVLERAISNIDAFIRGACPATYNELSKSFDSLLLKSLFSVHNSIQPLHEFKVGWKLEAVNPLRPYFVQPATVIKVFNSQYFLVELDDLISSEGESTEDDSTGFPNVLSSKIQFVAYAGMPEIMPVNESQLRGIYLSPPPGWPINRYFTWTNYLTYLSAHNGYLTNNESSSGDMNSSNLSNQDEFKNTTVDVTLKTTIINALHCTNMSSKEIDPVTVINDLPICPAESIFKGTHAFDSVQKLENSSNSSSEQNFSSLHSSKSGWQPKENDINYNNNRTDRNESNSSNRFLLGMKLEMVPPVSICSKSHSNFDIGPALCTATVTRVEYPHLLWLLPDIPCTENDGKIADYQRRPILMDARSTDLYPVGWSEFVGHPLIPPRGYDVKESISLEVCLEKPYTDSENEETQLVESCCIPGGLRPTHELQSYNIPYIKEEMCPPIFINSRCYLGPFLCKSNLDLLPRQFGPGSVTRVMQCLITRLVRAAHKPVRVLRMFEADWATGMASVFSGRKSSSMNKKDYGTTELDFRVRSNTLHPSLQQAKKEAIEQRREAMRVVLISVRCPRRGIKIEVPVEVCCRTRAVEEYCRQVSLVFEACPHLLSLVPPPLPEESKSTMPPIVSELDTNHPFSQEPNGIIPGLSSARISSGSISSISDCPSFCNTRLRSRYFDRLPGWKRRLTAVRAFTGTFYPDNDQNRAIFGAISSHTTRSTSTLRNLNWVNKFEPQSLFKLSNCEVSNSRNNNPVNKAKRKHRNYSRNSTEHCAESISDTFDNLNNCRTKSRRSVRCKLISPASKKCHNTSNMVSKNHRASSIRGSRSHYPPVYPKCASAVDTQENVQTPSTPNLQNSMELNNLSAAPSSHCLTLSSIPNVLHNNSANSVSPVTAQLPLDHIPPVEKDIDSSLRNIPKVILPSNPMFWTPVDLASYLGSTDCREMWPWLAAEAVDGQAFMLLTLPVLHRLVGLNWNDAVRLARHVMSVKQAFLEQFSMNPHLNETFPTETR
ncbi:Scm-like with four MBT domains protein [Schistosoma japonicum]|uniref:Scm-like with four MBT domains protein n=1 Tax=Schistosoma japonicum TaxID=6182 RepID=A0A4Z2CS77_SCHJA|nr:Scm-like with four MBT domains protein [Schistosoma japonicum]TNN07098.1 Scm-like with four MBT domains protein [Schistosoma japonicum]